MADQNIQMKYYNNDAEYHMNPITKAANVKVPAMDNLPESATDVNKFLETVGALAFKDEITYVENALRASRDGSDNVITDTYVRKDELHLAMRKNIFNCTVRTNANIPERSIIVGNNGQYLKLGVNVVFDVSYPILYIENALNAGETTMDACSSILIPVSNIQNITLRPGLPVYIKGKVKGVSFTVDKTNCITQTVPTSTDNFQYINIGVANDESTLFLTETKQMYEYKSAAFRYYGVSVGLFG